MPLTPLTRLGPYEILTLIGAGGMGEVYKARDTRLDRLVAIKTSKLAFTDRFEREARAIAAFDHPNICQLYDIGPDFLVMEYVEGTELKGPLPTSKAIEYAAQILDALDAAHRKGFTHRDLKPANILVTKFGVKLLDFGLARRTPVSGEYGTTATAAITRDGQVVGTVGYISPEQLEGKDADARSDLFAFGCVLYEMLSGRKAFEGSSAASVIAAVMDREPKPLPAAPALDRVLRACLAKDPNHRFQNAVDVKTVLNWAVDTPTVIPGKRARTLWLAVLALPFIAVPFLYRNGFKIRPATSHVNPIPVVILMDTSAPMGIYDPDTRKESRTNADDISDGLRDLPIAIHKETVGATWDREDQILKQNPDLILIHRAAFIHALVRDAESASVVKGQSAGTPDDSFLYALLIPSGGDKLDTLFGYVGEANSRTRFLVYSRDWPQVSQVDWERYEVRRFPELIGRLSTVSVRSRNGAASFRNPDTIEELRRMVQSMLKLSSSGARN